MHGASIERWQHKHVFLGQRHQRNERRTWLAVGLTAAMMIAEIVAGSVFGSLALLADGWHMSTHAAALGVSAFAYLYARRNADDPRFAFGTGKLGDLAAFASAIVLGMIAVLIAYESLVRLVRPIPIAYGQAIAVAIVGLAVNVICAWLLRDDHSHADRPHDHGHRHAHAHAHDHEHAHSHHRDNNLRAAYTHIMADAATSVLAIAGLLVAMSFNFVWIDALVGLVGAGVIAYWSAGLLRDAGRVLLDAVPAREIAEQIKARLETGGDRIADLHVWQVGPGHRAAVVSIVSDHPLAPGDYKRRLADVAGLSHLTVEVERCDKAAA